VELQVVITDRALLAGESTPAAIAGYRTVPAPWVRALVAPSTVGAKRTSDGSDAANRSRVWVRRLFTHPDDGTLVAMDSERRLFDGGLRRFLLARDGTCRTPWCNAPVRHVDHVVDHASGGPTSAENGQGLCVRCNHAKQAAGWRGRAEGGGDGPHRWRAHTVVITTPTGHRYSSKAPPVLVLAPDDEPSRLERAYERLLAA
jgi:5-methylcytosine-specific restriction endonuclease McrA